MSHLKVPIVCLLSVVVASMEFVSAQEQPALEITPLTQAQNDILLDSLRSSAVLELPPSHVSQVVDPNISGMWAGSKTVASLSMGEVTLRFRRKLDELLAATQIGQDLARESLESFELVVNALSYRMELQHSHPASPQDAKGIWVPLDSRKQQTLVPFISGQKNSGVYVGVLPTESRDNQWAVFVCPRKTTVERKSGAIVLGPSLYELFEAKVSVAAQAEAVMSTGGQEGSIKAVLSLSKDLPPSSTFEDESISAAPRVLIKYKPESPFDYFRFKPHMHVQQGASVAIEMQNKVGYRRKQYFSRYLYLHRTEEPTGVPVFVGNKRAASDTGECYVVVEQANSWATYDKVNNTPR